MRDCDCHWGCAVIKVSDLWAEVKKVAAEQPDYVYERPADGCAYEVDGKPSCLVGHAMFRLGMPLDLIRRCDRAGAIEHVLDEIRGEFDESGDDKGVYRTLLGWTQGVQDSGTPWGEAVSEAERFVLA